MSMGKHFWYDERLNRAGPGMAGASFEQQRIWNGNWSVAMGLARSRLSTPLPIISAFIWSCSPRSRS